MAESDQAFYTSSPLQSRSDPLQLHYKATQPYDPKHFTIATMDKVQYTKPTIEFRHANSNYYKGLTVETAPISVFSA
jgi:hypothetical protein